jgi:hypothetical protein
MLESETKRLRKQINNEKANYFLTNYKTIIKKRAIVLLVAFLLLAIGIAPYTIAPTNDTYVFQKHITVIGDTINKTHEKFLTFLGKTESGNNYKCVNSLGYCGKYQMGRSALVEIGLGGIKQEDFLNFPELQEIAMTLLLRKNKQFLQAQIGKYSSKTIKGIYVTESGLLAGAHLGGSGNVTKWLESNGENDFKDANGVPVSHYIKTFTGFNLKL